MSLSQKTSNGQPDVGNLPSQHLTQDAHSSSNDRPSFVQSPTINLPKGGGAIKSIGETFSTNPVTGTASMNVPIATSPGRSGFGPQLSLSYDSGSGNGPFGFGWNLSLATITRKTDKGIPQYNDTEESDVYILSGSEDLIPELIPSGLRWEDTSTDPAFIIHRYRPRLEGLFARIERWTNRLTGIIHWRSISRDNLTSWYGKTPGSCIMEAGTNTQKIFSWLICETYDDKGNAMVYEYTQENNHLLDPSLANERNRTRTAHCYLKRILYGNTISRLIQPNLALQSWLFEALFDYNEQHFEVISLDITIPDNQQHQYVRAAAASTPGPSWSIRPDPFSSYRSGFEVRTYRRCHRVLMFHRFNELGAEPCLVQSTSFQYDDLDYSLPFSTDDELKHAGSTRIASFLQSVTQSGYVRDPVQPVVIRSGIRFPVYLQKSLPSLEFEYRKPVIQDEIKYVDQASMKNLPIGIDGASYKWIDLNGEGVPGILSEQGHDWLYTPNLGQATFGATQPVWKKPSANLLTNQLVDLAGDGQVDLVNFDGPTPGFYEKGDSEEWKTFQPFHSLPSIHWNDPNLRLVDINGDGLSDILITENDVMIWYPSLGEDGFAAGRRVSKALDEEDGPRLVFSDSTQSIYLADMSGDGLTDIVRIRNGNVSYWANLGYGRFAPKVTMDNAPWFDNPDIFNQKRIYLSDIDGSGLSDIIYIGSKGATVYFNQAGNRWSDGRRLIQFPSMEDTASIMAIDLLANGTACLVWSSALPGNFGRHIRYIDLMGSQKPHLLTKSINNLGAETVIHYASSSRFYLADKQAGKPWITKLPFPVHVVERVEQHDRICGNYFVTRSAYHHGYFDGEEREFRGFGMVEQWDTEEFAALTATQQLSNSTNIDAASHVSPVLTRSWYHTGVYIDRNHVSNFYAGLLNGIDIGEYYREPGLSDTQAKLLLLDDTILPTGLTTDEERQACRALRGSLLRQEVYSLDGSAKEPHPYTVTEQNFTIRREQPSGINGLAVFFSHARESLHYYYDRDPSDPRISHSVTLDADLYGNITRAVAVNYGRRQPDLSLLSADQDRQGEIIMTHKENDVSNAITAPANDYHAPLVYGSRTYELTGLSLTPGSVRFSFSELEIASASAIPLTYDQNATSGVLQKRLVGQQRTLFRSNDLVTVLAPGTIESMVINYETYTMAFPSGLISVYGGRLSNSQIANEGCYVHSAGDSDWWIPSGSTHFSNNAGDTPAQELAMARQHFFLPQRFRTPFHSAILNTDTIITYDSYDLLLLDTKDAGGNRTTTGERDGAGNIVTQGNDYRVLQPSLMMDANRNLTQVAFNALGLVVGTAIMGKPAPSAAEGDTLLNFDTDLTQFIEQNHLQAPLTAPMSILSQASCRIIYDLFAYYRTKTLPQPQPLSSYSLFRETHHADPGGAATSVKHVFTYYDGIRREIQRKAQAESGAVPQRDPSGKIIVTATGQPLMTTTTNNLRWVGTGWSIYNNKGKVVRSYEPFFTDLHSFEFDIHIGVSPIIFYDPIERVIARLNPNHTWEKAVYTPWKEEKWDLIDTATITDPRTDADAGDFFARLPSTSFLPTWYTRRAMGAMGAAEQEAAVKTALLANTPTITYADSLSRAFLLVSHNRYKYSDAPVAAAPVDEYYSTRIRYDIMGNRIQVRDALDRLVVTHDYNMAGACIHQSSMEAGERWTFNNVADRACYVWDNMNHRFRHSHDALLRSTGLYLQDGANPEIQLENYLFGDLQPNAEASNLRTHLFQQSDQSGLLTNITFDFKGNILHCERQLVDAYNTTINWTTPPVLAQEIFTSKTQFDALNRPVQLIAPHSDQPGSTINIIQPTYNEAGLLNEVNAWLNRNAEPANILPSAGADLHAVTNIDYNSKGQRTRIDFGNGTITTYAYESETYRLSQIKTTRNIISFPGDCLQPPSPTWPGCQLQDLQYTYDPVGNVTHVKDSAQQTIFFNNKRVVPDQSYTYDATYRLIESTGREHLGQVGLPPTIHSYNDIPRIAISFSASDGNALGRYLERFLYDAVGNFLQVVHRGTAPSNPGWNRTFNYNELSLLDPGKFSNRLSSISGSITETYSTAGSGYDIHGNMLQMPQLQVISWNEQGRLKMTQRQSVNATDADGIQKQGERTWYVYDSAGTRIRKVTETSTGQVKEERIYLGGFEIYRRYGANPLTRETLHLMDGKQRTATIETRTSGNEPGLPPQLIRFQYSNHLGSGSIELDDQSKLISYEEYTAFGNTSLQLVRSQSETRNRYRYIGKERDEESGLYYHGARYYAPWLGRWTSCDPIWNTHLYSYVKNNPINFTDEDGREEAKTSTRLWGGVRALGGALQMLAGAVVFVQIEIPVAAQVVGGIAIAHGISDYEAGWRQVFSGKNEKSAVEMAVKPVAMVFTDDEKKAEAVATGVDMGLGFVSPAPISGGPRAAMALASSGSRASRVATMSRESAQGINYATKLAEAGQAATVPQRVGAAARGGKAASDASSSASGDGSGGGSGEGPSGGSSKASAVVQNASKVPEGFVDDAVKAVDEGKFSSDELISDLHRNGQSRAGRRQMGVTGATHESSHVGGVSAMKGLPGYNPRDAFARMLQKATHKAFDSYWLGVFQRMANASGETTIAVRDFFNVMKDAIGHNPHFSTGEANSMVELLKDELFVQHGLKDDDILRLPHSAR